MIIVLIFIQESRCMHTFLLFFLRFSGDFTDAEFENQEKKFKKKEPSVKKFTKLKKHSQKFIQSSYFTPIPSCSRILPKRLRSVVRDKRRQRLKLAVWGKKTPSRVSPSIKDHPFHEIALPACIFRIVSYRRVTSSKINEVISIV